jgi:acetyltransferase-like isoleucine patch superfamily enzyme
MKRIKITTNGTDNLIIIGDNCRLNNIKFVISGSHNRFILGNGICLNEVSIYTENDKNEITIGHKTTVHGSTNISAIEGTKVCIGEDCMFSKEIYIATGDGHTITNDEGIRINKSCNITIGNHVWVGTKTIINKGVIIGDNSIVGSGAVCTSKCEGEQGVIHAGNPALVVKRQINWERDRI